MLTRIASCHFHSVHAERGQYGGMYDIPAVGLNETPLVLEIQDKVQYWEGTFESSNVIGRRKQNKTMVWGEQIAEDLVAQWTLNGDGRTHNSHPGIWVVRDRIFETTPSGQIACDLEGKALFRTPTDEERDQMWEEDYARCKAADANYARYLITVADSMANDPRGSRAQFISPVAVAAAKAYAPNAAWLRIGHELIPNVCPYCQARVPAKVIKCPNCKEVVDLAAFAALQARQKKAVREAESALTAPAA